MRSKKNVALFGLLAISPLLSASEKITFKSSSKQGNDKIVLVEADLTGRSVDLTCFESHADCKELAPGDYELARLIAGEGSYNDCQNVDVYRIGADRLKEKPLGRYCLLQSLSESCCEASVPTIDVKLPDSIQLPK
jgi:hypothetical protein